MYYVYILLSEKDDKFYTGYTNDLKRRINEHSSGRVDSTKDRPPMKLIYYEACIDEIDARAREKVLKKSSNSRQWLKNRIQRSLDV